MKDVNRRTLRLTKKMFRFCAILSIAAGFLFAYLTVVNYVAFVRAILGVATILLLLLMFGPAKKGEERSKDFSRDVELELPKDLRVFLYNFVGTVLFVYALVQIMYLFKSLLFGN